MMARPVAAALLLLVNASVPSLTGYPRVVDGDTLAFGRQRVRLFGIDAPESGQSCRGADNVVYLCGRAAARELRRLIDGQAVTCEARDRDRYGRIVAVCRAGAVVLNGAMVREGWAVAYRRYSRDYVAAEDLARQAHAGLWAGTFELPAEWRAERR